MSKHDFAWVAKTAYGVAYARTFSHIDFAQEVLPKLRAIAGPESAEQEKVMIPGLIPYFEARYLLVNRILKEMGAKQILEIASGMSFRGTEMTKDVSIVYTELDQPIMVALKRKVIRDIASESPFLGRCFSYPNWHLRNGNALDRRSMSSATFHFDRRGEVAVVNEGLLPYFTHEQKAIYAKNVSGILARFGGAWITPDIALRDGLKDIPGYKKVKKLWHKSVSRNLDANTFEDKAAAKAFYEDLGFDVEARSFAEVIGEMASIQKLGLSLERYRKIFSRQAVFVMRLQ